MRVLSGRPSFARCTAPASSGFLASARAADTPLERAPLWTVPEEPHVVRRAAGGMLRDEFSLSDYAPILDVPPPCCVASALVRFNQ
jgi:hypothetical protein